jgi:hypothetical protein
VSEMEHPGDSLRVLPGSPGSRRKLSDMKAQSLDYDRSYGASNHAERPRSFDMLRTETFGSSMDSASGDISPGFMSENQSDERRSRSDEPDSVMSMTRGRGHLLTCHVSWFALSDGRPERTWIDADPSNNNHRCYRR